MYVTYRDGANPMEERIKKACQAFYAKRHQPPVGIVVNKNELDAATSACKALGLKLPVDSTGGCLIPEVWLRVKE